MKKEKTSVQDWRLLVESKGRGLEARGVLAELLTGDRSALDGADENILSQQDFITAVPIEIALSVPERARIRKAMPDCKWIVTGVPEKDVERLHDCLGYQVTYLPDLPAEECDEVDCSGKSQFNIEYTVNGQTVKAAGSGTPAEVEEAIRGFIQGLQN